MKAFQTPKSCYFPSSYHPSSWKTASLRAGLGYDWASQEAHRLSLRNCRNCLFTALTLAPCDHASQSLLSAHRSATPRLAAPDISGCQGGNSKLRQTCTCQTHTLSQRIRCSQQPSVKVERMRLLLFITIPKPQLDFQRAFKKVSVYWRKIAGRLLSSKTELGLHTMYGMTKIWVMIVHYVNC